MDITIPVVVDMLASNVWMLKSAAAQVMVSNGRKLLQLRSRDSIYFGREEERTRKDNAIPPVTVSVVYIPKNSGGSTAESARFQQSFYHYMDIAIAIMMIAT